MAELIKRLDMLTHMVHTKPLLAPFLLREIVAFLAYAVYILVSCA